MDTKKIIMDAACRVFKRCPFEKVTVQRILDEAGVSRSSFYKYFKDKYDVVEQFCFQNIERVFDEVTSDPGVADYRLLNQKLNYIANEHSDMYRILYQKDPECTLERCLEASIYQMALAGAMESTRQPVSEAMKASALCCAVGICRLIREWTLGNIKMDVEEFTAMTNWILMGFIDYHMP